MTSDIMFGCREGTNFTAKTWLVLMYAVCKFRPNFHSLYIFIIIYSLLYIFLDSCENIPGRKPLGMENFQIANSQLSASSELRAQAGPSVGRLNHFTSDTRSGSWVSKVNDENQWFQVDFLRTVKVTGLATQGRKHWPQWVKEFTVSYKQGKDDVEFQFYKKQGIVKVSGKNFLQSRTNIVQMLLHS